MRRQWSKMTFVALLISGCVVGQQTQFVAFQSHVVAVSAGSRLSQVRLPRQTLMASLLGTTAPTVSPDNKWIAFVRNQDLWLYETATQQVKRATSIGRPYTKVFASIEVLIVAWSRDGGRILIRTEPGETGRRARPTMDTSSIDSDSDRSRGSRFQNWRLPDGLTMSGFSVRPRLRRIPW